MKVIEQTNFKPGETWESPKTGFEIDSYATPEITDCKRIYVRGNAKMNDGDIVGKNFKDCETAKKSMEEIIEAIEEFNEYYAHEDEDKTDVSDVETAVVG